MSGLLQPTAVNVMRCILASVLVGFSSATWSGEIVFNIAGDSYDIPAVLSLPDDGEIADAREEEAGTAMSPAVLLLHGTASNKDEVGGLFVELAARLRTVGIASLRIDFAGNGDSDIDHRRFTLESAVRDSRKALDVLREYPGIDANSLAVLGFSQGALIAQRTVLAAPRVAALVTWSGVAADGIGNFQRYFDAHYAIAQEQGYASVEFGWLPEPLNFDLQWFEQMKAQTTFSDMKGFEKPILAIAGNADASVPHQSSLELVAQSTHRGSRAVVLAQANHIFNVLESPASIPGSSADQLLATTVSWLSWLLKAHR